jgi:hypothetical protein
MHNVGFHNLYCLSGGRESKNNDKMGMGMHEGNLKQIIDWKMVRKESIQKNCMNIGG